MEQKRDSTGKFVPGGPGGPGRPKGQTMKEFSREWFFQMSNEEKLVYIANLEKVRPGFAWTMSEGNPTEDKNVTVRAAVPILGSASQAITAELIENTENRPSIEDGITPPVTTSSPQAAKDTPQDGLDKGVAHIA